jgi:RNA polymerase sigma-70 factor (ECF subfamily)
MDKTSIPWKELPDSEKEQYFELYKDGDEKGLEFVFRQIYPDLFKYTYRKIKDLGESEDIAQQSIIKVWYQKDRPEFANLDKLRSYHFVTARNSCITFLKRRGKYKSADFDGETPDGSSGHPFQRTEDKELYDLVLKHIRQLPEPQRGIALARIQGRKYKEIAEEYDLSVERVGTILSRLWGRLRRYLAGYR